MAAKAIEYAEHSLCYHPKGNSPYKCVKCETFLLDKDQYIKHMEAHLPKDGKYRCPICFIVHGNKTIYLMHWFSFHHKTKQHSANEEMPVENETPTVFIRPPVQQVLTFKSFKKKRTIRKRSFSCSKCSFVTTYSAALARHRCQKLSLTNQCPYCSYSSLYKKSFLEHIQSHSKKDKSGGE